MPTVTISLAGSAIVNGSKPYTISDPDVQTLINHIIAKYSPAAGPPLTNTQALLKWTQLFVDNTTNEVHRKQVNDAQQAINIPPIVFNP